MSRTSRDTASSDATSGSSSTGYPFEEVTDEELEIYLSELEEQEESGYWNFSTLAGLGLIVVGTLYLLEQVGLFEGIGISLLASMLPWFAGVLIILVGFGVLSWESSSSRRSPSGGTRAARKRSRPRDENDQAEHAHDESAPHSDSHESDDAHSAMSPDITKAARNFVQAVRRTLTEKRLTKSRDKKISGVCGGLAEYVGLDPTLMRIAWVAATIFGFGSSVLLYVILMLVMPGPDEVAPAEKIRVTISRD